MPRIEDVWLIIGLLCVAGIVDTIYVLRFTFVPKADVDPEAACRIDDPGHCQTLFQSETAKLVGNIPNSALGFVFYGVVGISGFAYVLGTALPIWWIVLLIAAALGAVAMSVYLFHHLVFVRKTTCVPCFIGQGINVLILVLLGFQVWRYFTILSQQRSLLGQ